MDVKGRIKELVKELNIASDSYYNQGISLMTDYEFDMKLLELKDLEAKFPEFKRGDSPTDKVGSVSKSSFEKVKHEVPMLSLDNSYNKEDIEAFIRRVKKVFPKAQFVMEYKYDGMSISLEYKNSELVRAVSRGDGEVGDDITENVKMIPDVPRFIEGDIKYDITIRGEILLSRRNFVDINKARAEQGLELYMNPRNTVAGTMRQHDPNVVKQRRLETRMYYMFPQEAKLHTDTLSLIDFMGFNVSSMKFPVYNNVEDIMRDIELVEKNRNSLSVEIDGMVIKVQQTEYWDELGYTGRAPRYAIAYKFDTEKATTKLKDVVWQVGRTGKLTPVALFDKVILAETEVVKSTLHNMDQINMKDIRIGDSIIVEKAAEIIPQVIGPVKLLRDGTEKIIVEPTTCPVCGSNVRRHDDKVDLFCSNWNCSSRTALRIEHFVSRDAVNIVGMGPSNIQDFIKSKLIENIEDVFSLADKLKDSPYIIERKIARNIETAKDNNPIGLLFGLGIPGVGKGNAKKLMNKFCSLDNILGASIEELESVVGKVVAENINIYGTLDSTAIMLDKLKRVYKVRTVMEKCKLPDTSKFSGKFFVITGKMEHYLNKREVIDIIEANGGIVLTGVNKSVDYLIVGDSPGSKLERARELGTTCLTELAFKELAES